jgi:hypothetical protein
MISPLDDQPLSEVMEMLEVIAERHDLLLSLNLINFADDIYKIGYERGIRDESLYQDMKEI